MTFRILNLFPRHSIFVKLVDKIEHVIYDKHCKLKKNVQIFLKNIKKSKNTWSNRILSLGRFEPNVISNR